MLVALVDLVARQAMGSVQKAWALQSNELGFGSWFYDLVM